MEPTCVQELKECREPQRRETGTVAPSENGTASPGLSQALWGRLRKFPKQILLLGSPEAKSWPPICLCLKVVLEIKLTSLTYRLNRRGKKNSFLAWVKWISSPSLSGEAAGETDFREEVRILRGWRKQGEARKVYKVQLQGVEGLGT